MKLPTEDGAGVYLPIDSKFPGDAYEALVQAYDAGDKAQVEEAAKVLRSRILSFAKDIHDKYIDPPGTTDFAVMFLPFEGLYAEVVNRGLVEELQNRYKINVAGPSTMGRPSQQPANGLPHLRHPEAQQRSVGGLRGCENGIRQIRRRAGSHPEALGTGQQGAGQAGGGCVPVRFSASSAASPVWTLQRARPCSPKRTASA